MKPTHTHRDLFIHLCEGYICSFGLGLQEVAWEDESFLKLHLFVSVSGTENKLSNLPLHSTFSVWGHALVDTYPK